MKAHLCCSCRWMAVDQNSQSGWTMGADSTCPAVSCSRAAPSAGVLLLTQSNTQWHARRPDSVFVFLSVFTGEKYKHCKQRIIEGWHHIKESKFVHFHLWLNYDFLDLSWMNIFYIHLKYFHFWQTYDFMDLEVRWRMRGKKVRQWGSFCSTMRRVLLFPPASLKPWEFPPSIPPSSFSLPLPFIIHLVILMCFHLSDCSVSHHQASLQASLGRNCSWMTPKLRQNVA